MEVSTVSATPAEGTKALYMLYWGESYERGSSGPFHGAAGLDFVALAGSYRKARYAAAEAKQEDYCMLGEDDFVGWLVETGILSPIETKNVGIEIRTTSDNAYVPKHWPECPECSTGRGDKEYGEVRRSLNRVNTFRRCTECQHEWGHTEEANNSTLPMSDDDGRDTPGACVPFAISKACGLDFAMVMRVCVNHGWKNTGMAQTNAIVAARELGFALSWKNLAGVGTSKAPTLKRLLPMLAPRRNYIAGVKGHWLAIVDGQIVDNDTNSGLGRKVQELYEINLVQAAAA